MEKQNFRVVCVDEDAWASKDSRVVLCKPRDNQRVK